MARILVVDDSKLIRMTLSMILTQAGHEVVGQAVNGKDCLEQYEKLKPDLVTLDIMMEGFDEQGSSMAPADMDGIKCLAELKKRDPAAKVLMVSSQTQVQPVALGLGALGFIGKPFKPDGVAEAVKKALG